MQGLTFLMSMATPLMGLSLLSSVNHLEVMPLRPEAIIVKVSGLQKADNHTLQPAGGIGDKMVNCFVRVPLRCE